jgi:hypothetical protein
MAAPGAAAGPPSAWLSHWLRRGRFWRPWESRQCHSALDALPPASPDAALINDIRGNAGSTVNAVAPLTLATFEQRALSCLRSRKCENQQTV